MHTEANVYVFRLLGCRRLPQGNQVQAHQQPTLLRLSSRIHRCFGVGASARDVARFSDYECLMNGNGPFMT